MSTTKEKPAFRAFAINRRGDKEEFFEIGAAWKTTKGGYVIRLKAQPLGDTLILSLPKKQDETADTGATG